MAKDLNVSEATVRKVVKKNIGARSLAKNKKFLFTYHPKALRMERSEKLLFMLKIKSPILLFSDEKYFTVDVASESQTDHFITKKNDKKAPDAIRSV